MDGLVLLAKRPGRTSFSSLFYVKKALNTTKVGHTGTLDSFAQGLLVVCTGRYTRLASNITEFNKSYKAVISFGKETDTLEYTGSVIKTGNLPSLVNLKSAINKFCGNIMQSPPAFSAIHIDGKRASDLARNGKSIEIPKRPVSVFRAELIDYVLDEQGNVKHCLIEFDVSKGTYIRSLARDIALECNSCGYLSGLYRTKVGNFKIEDSAGFSLMEEFNINNCLETENKYLHEKNIVQDKKPKEKYVETPEDIFIKNEILAKILPLSKKIAKDCGFYPITILDEKADDFLHGKPLRKNFFNSYMDSLKNESVFAVFSTKEDFLGLIEWKDSNKLGYKFVNN